MFQRLTLLSASLLLIANISFAQQSTAGAASAKSIIEKPSRDFVMLQFTYDGWANTPDSVKTGGLGRGFNAYLCYDFPIQKSHFSFAAGIGIGTSNIFLKDQQISFTDTGVLANRVQFVNEERDYKRYKLTTAFLEAPFELRYFSNRANRNKGFKASIGARVGYMVNAHTKAVYTVDGNKTVEKVGSKRYLEKWRFGATVRAGYGNFSLFGAYNFNNVFRDGSGPQATPYSIGLCITGL
jgi:hypothetical protein